MAWRCDKCRSEYESGVQFGGHDYCMTCYIRVKQDEDAKRKKEQQRQEEIRKQKEKEYSEKLEKESQMKRDKMRREALEGGSYGSRGMAVGRHEAGAEGGWSWHNRMMERRDKADEDKKKREIQEDNLLRKQLEELVQRRKDELAKGTQEDETRIRHQWSVSLEKKEEALRNSRPDAEKDRNWLNAAVSKNSFVTGYMPGKRYKPEPSDKRVHAGRGWRLETQDQPALTLLVTKGLPVSLSVGQKKNVVLLSGKNRAQHKIAVELVASLVDSKGGKIGMKLEPGKCGLEAGSEAAFSVEFDLKEDTARGVLSFGGQLKETAIYVDREGAQSETIRLECEVKTPLDLSYRKGSAAFLEQDGNLYLVLRFDNKGESGGILSAESQVSYGKESGRLKAALVGKTKVKGMEKNVHLKFLAEKEAPTDKISIGLLGVDANGKPYAMQKTVVERKSRA